MMSRRLIVWMLLLVPCQVRADGGTLCLVEQTGGYRVALFSSPTPFRAGPVDLSVLVQDASTGRQLSQARVNLRLYLHGGRGAIVDCPATTEAATNKLFYAAKFELPVPGLWKVEIHIDGPRGKAVVRCELEAAEALPAWLEFWPWVGWPALVILLFGVHQFLVR